MTEPAGRLPPHDLEAERAVLGATLIEKSVIDRVREILPDAKAFYQSAHQSIYDAVVQLSEQSKNVDHLTVSDALRGAGRLDAVGGTAYLMALTNSVVTAVNAEQYAEIVRDKAILRRLGAMALGLAEQCYGGANGGAGGGEAPEGVTARAAQQLFEIQQRGMPAQFTDANGLMMEFMDRINFALTHKKPLLGIASGFTDFDKLISGLNPTALIVVGGRPSMGKSTLVQNLALHVALEQKKTVAFFSLETSSQELGERLACMLAGVSPKGFRSGMLSRQEAEKLLAAAGRIAETGLFIDDSMLSPPEMKVRARRLKQERGLDLIIVDYLQMIQGKTGRSEYRQQDVAEISRSMKVLAKDLRVPVIAVSQLSRETEKRGRGSKPQLADLRESGAIEQDADVVAFVHRDEYYEPENDNVKGLAELIVRKNRNGPTGTVSLTFRGEVFKFENASRREA